jgi:methionyl-tRNA formyltransferase
LRRELPRFLRGELQPTAQDHARHTLAPLLTKDAGRMRLTEPAGQLAALVRGVHPWPGAFTFLGGQRIKVHRAHVLLEAGRHGEPGEVLRCDRHGIELACGQGVLVLDELQPEGKRRMSAEQFCAGLRTGERLRFEPGEGEP